jgi:hypothetical protein
MLNEEIEQNEKEPEQEAEEPSLSKEQYQKILDEVLNREKVIKKEWLDKTKDSYSIYEGAKSAETPFNILYSNTEILVPNLFSSAPKPVVRRRFGERRADDAAKAAERMAEYCMDTNLGGYPDFVDAVESCVLDAALPGQGQSRVRVVDGIALIDYVQHDAFIWAYAKRWEDTGWIAYRHDKLIVDAVREFGLSSAIAAAFVAPTDTSTGEQDKSPPTIAVYEVWSKSRKEVYFQLASRMLSESFVRPTAAAGVLSLGKASATAFDTVLHNAEVIVRPL